MMINTVLKWLATVVTVAGAVAVTHNLDPLNIYLLNLASILWIVWGLRIREWSIVVVNASLMAIYIYGLIIRML
jgi:hypothetical protein